MFLLTIVVTFQLHHCGCMINKCYVMLCYVSGTHTYCVIQRRQAAHRQILAGLQKKSTAECYNGETISNDLLVYVTYC